MPRKKLNWIGKYEKRMLKKSVQSYKCSYCGKKGKRMELHHVIPLSEGGPDTSDNVCFVHKKCHKRIHSNRKPQSI